MERSLARLGARWARGAGLAFALAACAPQPVVVATPTPTASPTAPVASPPPTPSPAPTPTPTPRPTASPGIRATAVGAIPDSFRYVALETPVADGFHTRLWLVDLTGLKPPVVAAEWDGPAAPVGGHSVSADGRGILVAATGRRARVALYLLTPETGASKVLYEEPGAIVISPRLAPAGDRFAFTKQPDGAARDEGIWAGPTAGGDLKRIAEPSATAGVPLLPLAWSVDGEWLALAREAERSEVRLVRRAGGGEVAVGEGHHVSWRRNPPELLVASSTPAASRVYAFDLATRKETEIVRLERQPIPYVEWHPALESFVYVQTEGAGREASGGIWSRRTDGSGAVRIDGGQPVYAPRWSRDGTILSVLGGGGDAVVPVLDLLTGRGITVLCRRGGTPPADCV